MGWFYGLKLHLVINAKAEIIQWMLTAGNEEDCKPLKDKRFTDSLFGKLFADRGYMKISLMSLYDRSCSGNALS